MHTADSHAVDNRKFLKHKQRIALVNAVQLAPLSTPVEVRRNLKQASPEKRIKAANLTSIRRAVRQVRSDMTAVAFPMCSVPVDGSLGSLTSLCESIFLPNLIRSNNNVTDDFHLDFHKMICIAFKTDGGTVLHALMLYSTFDRDVVFALRQGIVNCSWPFRILTCWAS